MRYVKKNGLYVPKKKPEHYMGCMGIEEYPVFKKISGAEQIRRGVLTPASSGSMGGGAPVSGGSGEFGYTNLVGTSTGTVTTTGHRAVLLGAVAIEVEATGIAWYCQGNVTGGVKIGIYSNESSLPHDLMDASYTTIASIGTWAMGWHTFSLSPTITLPAGTYWACIDLDGTGASITFTWIDLGSGTLYAFADSVYATSLTNPFLTPDATNSYQWCCKVLYTY